MDNALTIPTVDHVLAAHEVPQEAPPEAGPEPHAGAAPPPPSPPPAEAAPAEEAPQAAPPPRDDTADRLLVLMEQERQLRAAREEVSTREAALQREQQTVAEQAARLQKLQQLEQAIMAKDAGLLLDYLDVSPDEFIESAQAGRGADPTRQLREEIKRDIEELRKAQEDMKTSAQAREQARTMEEARAEIRTGLEEHSPALAALASMNPQVVDGVYESIRAHYRETREVPSLQQVTPALEQEALAQAVAITEALLPYYSDAAKERLRSALAPQGEAAGRVTQQSAAPKPTRTLTNEGTAGPTNIEPDLELTFDRDRDIAQIMAKYGIR